ARDLPLAAPRWKALYIDFGPASLVGDVRQPSAVGGELRPGKRGSSGDQIGGAGGRAQFQNLDALVAGLAVFVGHFLAIRRNSNVVTIGVGDLFRLARAIGGNGPNSASRV